MGQTSTFTEKDRWKTYKISYKEPKEVSKQMKWGAGQGERSLLLRCKIQCKVEKLSKQDPQKSPTGQSPSPARRGQTTPLTAKSLGYPCLSPQFAKPHQSPSFSDFLTVHPRSRDSENPRVGIISLASSLTGLGRERRRVEEEAAGQRPFPNPPAGGSLSLQPAHPRPAHRDAPARYAPRRHYPPLLRPGVRPRRPLILPLRPREPCLPSRSSGPRCGEGRRFPGGQAARPPAPRRPPRAATLPRELSSRHGHSARDSLGTGPGQEEPEEQLGRKRRAGVA